MAGFRPSHMGFFGKLPAHGDFVRAGLPEDFVAPLDQWCRECLVASRSELGEAWTQCWMVAPIWQFRLPPGACGPRAALGLWMPSADHVARHYPFLLCALADDAAALEAGAAWLAAAEACGLACVVEDAPPEALAAKLAGGVADAMLPGLGWWTAGSEHVGPRHYHVSTLFPPLEAVAMLRDPAPVDVAGVQ